MESLRKGEYYFLFFLLLFFGWCRKNKNIQLIWNFSFRVRVGECALLHPFSPSTARLSFVHAFFFSFFFFLFSFWKICFYFLSSFASPLLVSLFFSFFFSHSFLFFFSFTVPLETTGMQRTIYKREFFYFILNFVSFIMLFNFRSLVKKSQIREYLI